MTLNDLECHAPSEDLHNAVLGTFVQLLTRFQVTYSASRGHDVMAELLVNVEIQLCPNGVNVPTIQYDLACLQTCAEVTIG